MKLLCLTFFLVCAFSSSDATFPFIVDKLMDAAGRIINKVKNFIELSKIDDNEVNKFIQTQAAKNAGKGKETQKPTLLNLSAAQKLGPAQGAVNINIPGIPKPAVNVAPAVASSATSGLRKGTQIPAQLNVHPARQLSQSPNLGATLGTAKPASVIVPGIPNLVPTVGPLISISDNAGLSGKGTRIPKQLNFNSAQKLGRLSNLGASSGTAKSSNIATSEFTVQPSNVLSELPVNQKPEVGAEPYLSSGQQLRRSSQGRAAIRTSIST